MFEILNNPELSNFFGALGGLGDAGGAIMGMGALIYSMFIYKESVMLSHYSELDSTYAGLLEKCIEHTHFANPQADRNPEETIQYDTYAFMVWNFIETIVDRCGSDKKLHETWHPIVLVEAKKHIQWFNREENKDKFKESFRHYILGLLAQEKTVQFDQSKNKKAV